MKKHRILPHANRDFGLADLPKNRREVFRDRLKNRTTLFLRLGVILLVFALPYLAFHFWRDFELSSLYAQAADKTIDETTLARLVLSTKNSFNLIDLGTFALFGVGVAGSLRVLEHLSYDEPVFFAADFGRGIKQNGLLTASFFFLAALGDALISFSSSFSIANSQLIEGILYGLGIFFFLPLAFFVIAEGVVYRLPLKGYYQNASVFYLKHLFPSLLATLAGVLPWLAEWIPNILAKEIVWAVLVVFYCPLYLFAFFLFANALMDQHVNSKYYPDRVGKGFHSEGKS